ncbi:hypothetical protein [Saccharopolyspora sp. NPDC002578]
MTRNLKDFPRSALANWNIEAKHPDAFVLDQVHLDHAAVYAALQRMADSCTHPPRTVGDVLGRLGGDGLVESVAALQAM